MKRMSGRALSLAALLWPVCALADPRGIGEPPEPLTPEAIEARRVQRVEEIRAWLPRLVGQFEYKGIVDMSGEAPSGSGGPFGETFSIPQPPNPFAKKFAQGLGDCVAIGGGPGVHCVVDINWEDAGTLSGPVMRGADPFLSPASTLYGIDAIAGVIRYLQLDKDGLTETETAFVKGNTLIWIFYTGQASTGQARKERRITRIYARPESNVVQTNIEIETLTSERGWELRASITFDGQRVSRDAGPERLPMVD